MPPTETVYPKIGYIVLLYDRLSPPPPPPPPLVSYPDPTVRNDDYRLQYDITYRGSGNEVVILECRWNVHCYIIVVSSQIPTTSLIRNQLWTTAKCAVLRSQMIDLDGYTRLVGKDSGTGMSASCRYLCRESSRGI